MPKVTQGETSRRWDSHRVPINNKATDAANPLNGVQTKDTGGSGIDPINNWMIGEGASTFSFRHLVRRCLLPHERGGYEDQQDPHTFGPYPGNRIKMRVLL